MVVVLFMNISLFATANNGKIWEKKICIGELTSKAPLKTKVVAVWMYTVTCGGHVYTGCCWETQSQAYAHGQIEAYHSCD